MRYADGQQVLLGDTVGLGEGALGTVVAVIDTGNYSERYTAADWSYLSDGALLESTAFGLLHCIDSSDDFTLVCRAG